jgi:hypothetical protein
MFRNLFEAFDVRAYGNAFTVNCQMQRYVANFKRTLECGDSSPLSLSGPLALEMTFACFAIFTRKLKSILICFSRQLTITLCGKGKAAKYRGAPNGDLLSQH